MYKILSLIFIILFSAAAYSQSISMSAPAEVTGTAETQFVIQIKAGDPNSVSNFLGASFNLTWNNTSYVEAVSTAPGNFLGSNPLIIAQNYNDHIEVGVTSTTGGKNGSGVIAQCTLKVKQNVSSAVDVNFNLQNVTGMDALGNSISLLPANNPLKVILQPLPVLTVTPDNQNVNSSAGTTSFSVSNTGGGTLNWNTIVSGGWAAITNGSTGTNSGTIDINYTANSSCDARVCTLRVYSHEASESSKLVTITQSGNNTPILSAEPVQQNLTSSAGNTMINISNTGCGQLNWNAAENSDWLNITNGGSGINNGIISISYNENTLCETRVCTLTVTAPGAAGSPKAIFLTQAGNGIPVLSVNPLTKELPSAAGTSVIDISNQGCGTLNWTASEDASWITITSGSTGINNGSTNFSYTANTGCETRTCTLTVSAPGSAGSPKSIILSQPGSGIPVLTVDPETRRLSSLSGSTVINVTNAGCGTFNWNVTENCNWLNITSGSTGTNSGAINISYTANLNCNARVCTLTVIAENIAGSPKQVILTQEGDNKPILTVMPLNQLDLTASAGTTSFNVSNTGCGSFNWTADVNSGWVTITGDSSGTNSGIINLSYTANTGCDSRVCTLTVTAAGVLGSPKRVILTQQGGVIPVLSVDPLSKELQSEAGTSYINISNSGCGTLNWNAEENSEWVSIISGNTGTNSGTVNISFTANSACEARVCTLTVTATGAAASPQKIILTQPGSGTPILSVSPAEQNLSPEKGTLIINIYNQGCGTLEWTAAVQEGSEWFKIDEGAAGSDSGEIICSYESNNTNMSRIAKLHIYNDDDSAVVTITQDFATGVFDDFIIKENFLYQNYPNPFNPSTVIRYSLLQESNVTIKLYDVLGNEIITLADEYKSPGIYSVEVDARSITSGIYYYRITADNFVQTKKMILVK